MKTQEKQSVVQEWVAELPFQMQAVLLMALRGPDGIEKKSPAKQLLHALRGCILHPAFDMEETIPTDKDGDYQWNCYMVHPECIKSLWFDRVVNDFFADVDKYPMHFLMHLLHAIEILGYEYPYDMGVTTKWAVLYNYWCEQYHLRPETRYELHNRLSK
jgi:hypothetical protein